MNCKRCGRGIQRGRFCAGFMCAEDRKVARRPAQKNTIAREIGREARRKS